MNRLFDLPEETSAASEAPAPANREPAPPRREPPRVWRPQSEAELTEGLNPPQREAVLHTSGPLLVIAGAGSGKTRVITHRVAKLVSDGVHPRNILAITFTNKAAGEMRERIDRLVGEGASRAMWVLTFHSACARILRIEAARRGAGKNFTIYDDSDQRRVVGSVIKELNLDPKKWTDRGMLSAISSAKNECISAKAFAAAASNYFERTVADVYSGYDEALRKSNALDFDDLLLHTVELLEGSPETLKKWRDRFQHIVVDEYQDTNPVQYRMVKLLADAHQNICVVGDEDQSVYAFRGATIRNILEFERDWPSATVIKLEQNYRSTQNILDAANALIQNNTQRKGKNLFTTSPGGDPIQVYRAEDEHDEASYIAGQISRGLKEGRQGADYAIFYRTNAQSRVLEETLMRYGIPYRVVGGLKFWDRREVKDTMAWLRAATNPADRLNIIRAMGSPSRGLGEKSIAKIEMWASSQGLGLADACARASEITNITPRARNAALEVARVIKEINDADLALEPLDSIVTKAFTESGLLASFESSGLPEDETRIENLRELSGVAAEFESGDDIGEGRLADFLERTALVNESDVIADDSEFVTLMTIHNAKGLEYPVVFCTGWENGVFPHIRSLDDPEQMEEERRLAYVGVTRAQTELHITHAWARMLWGGTQYNAVSPFLEEIPEDLCEVSGELNRKSREFTWEGRRTRGYDGEARQSAGRGGDRSSFAGETRWGPKRRREGGGDGLVVNIRIGDRVHHEVFGTGVVLEVSGVGSDAEVTVDFDDEGRKRLMAAYANLSKA